MRQRFTINDAGFLVDRHGYELGRVVGITLDLKEPLTNPPLGDIGGLSVNGLTATTKAKTPDGGVGETTDGPSEVWAHYVEVMQPRNKQLDPAARALIRDALKVATAVECCRAIDGCRASAFHMGANDRGKKYNRLSQILKGKRGIRTTREQMDLFLDIAEKVGVGPSVSSADPARLAEAKRNVLTGWEFPKSGQAQEMAKVGAAWLAQHHIRVERDPESGRPTFIQESEA